MWKNEKFTVTKKKFRQINSPLFSLVKTLLSRIFCQRQVTVNFHNFHTVEIDRNFVKTTFHNIKRSYYLNSVSISRNIFRKELILYFSILHSFRKIHTHASFHNLIIPKFGDFFFMYKKRNISSLIKKGMY